ncbi:MAG: hypothetical protein DCC58_04140 [Chloroflexi bacterium]|nr:MAG: hypothetical protein DCC58_04140 [Chloroflexota bacterium]
MNRRRFRSLASLGAFLAATGVAALAGSLATRDAIDSWYQELRKPSFNPPSWVFAPVWTLLYGAMATAGWLTWRKRSTHQHAVDRATRVFGLQLLLNAAWSGMFFGLRRPLLGLLDILALLATLVYWLRAAGRVEPRTRLLILPYIAWVTFAALLNAAIWWRNH